MLENHSYQVYFFGDFREIEAESKIVMKLMQLLERFSMVPGTSHELNPGISPVPVPRPMFTSFADDFSIEIGSERISIIKNSVRNNGDDTENIRKFVNDSTYILDKITTEFNKKGSRISLVTEGLFSQMDEEKLDSMYLKFASPLGYYESNKPVEWNSRSVSRIKQDVVDREETINVITEVGRIQGRINNNGMINDFDRINLKVDINTIPQLAENRLKTESIESFLNLAMENRKELISQVEMVMNGESI
ncbi:hypothetical protein ACQVPY_13760 [Bacillus pretiosus]|uniref:hypothetical protein n=1 Tax=Bacillus pretiosus TaxID=2983392 RepID=UPI003D64FC8E